MKPVVQTILTAPGGDCFPACIASILEMDLAEVPNYQGEHWQHHYHAWLAPLGLAFLTTNIPSEELIASWPGMVLPGYTILAVDSPRHPGHLHAVVALDGVVVWDPHPAATAADYSNLIWREVSYFASLNARMSIADRVAGTGL